ncbi:hypothetical protein L6452_05501 [Arctium lappa]|uniref:Uncharacterized protein n=1 Tax=Arctium lappa TaxID=4217 RepID=A0ACB9EGW1_ARCLA|nr:hypothetical protein L6452_05501 [Arctium lappa]
MLTSHKSTYAPHKTRKPQFARPKAPANLNFAFPSRPANLRIMDDDYFDEPPRQKSLSQKLSDLQEQYKLDQMSISKEYLSTASDMKPTVLERGQYEQWKHHFLDFIDKHKLNTYIRLSLQEGMMKIPTKVNPYQRAYGNLAGKEVPIYLNEYTDDQQMRHEADKFAKVLLLKGISEEITIKIYDCKWASAKMIWDQLEALSQLSPTEKVKVLEAENSELQKKISDFEKKFSDLSKKSVEEKKTLELKCLMLSQKVEEFEKVIILERDQFAKERKANDQKGAKKGFEEERSILEAKLKKLTEKLSELSKSVLTEKKKKSAFEKKIELLIKERNSYSSKVKELQDIISKTVVVTERTTPESKIHSPRNNSVGSNKPAASSHQKTALFKRSVKSSNQIHSTNLFYDRNIDCSSTHQRRRRSFQEEAELVWNRKPVKEELKCKNLCVHKPIAKKNNVLKGKPDFFYSRDKLISLSGKKFYCSYCRTHDPVHKTSDHYWYGSYSVTPIRTATNTYGPKYQWVAKKTKPVLQAPTVKGE